MLGRHTDLLDLGAAIALTVAAAIGGSYLGWRTAIGFALLVAGLLALWASHTLTKRSPR